LPYGINTLYDLVMGVNTKYKDSVFSFLFSDPDVRNGGDEYADDRMELG
jgi:hypothetical protein